MADNHDPSNSENEKDPFDELSKEERLHAENELLKLKLTGEFGMLSQSESTVEPELENDFLKHILEFEKQHEQSKAVKLIDHLGNPSFTDAADLTDDQIEAELDRLLDLMEAQNIRLDVCEDYDAIVIYKFLTEELFQEEIYPMNIPGMFHHFIYEEFHPNHKKDIESRGIDFLNAILEKEWEEFTTSYFLEPIVSFNDQDYDRALFSKIISEFQLIHFPISIQSIDLKKIEFTSEKENAEVHFSIHYQSEKSGTSFKGVAILKLTYDFVWSINSLIVPGLSAR